MLEGLSSQSTSKEWWNNYWMSEIDNDTAVHCCRSSLVCLTRRGSPLSAVEQRFRRAFGGEIVEHPVLVKKEEDLFLLIPYNVWHKVYFDSVE